MSDAARLALYSVAIGAGALAGASLPLLRGPTAPRMNVLLSFSAGVMLGAAFFHMLPEAVAGSGLAVMGWAIPGFLFLFLLERYVLVHFCAEQDDGCEVHGLHPHEPGQPLGAAHRPHGTVGIAAFLGLTVHTLVDGLALGSAIDAGVGASVFLAILLHKSPSSFALATILRHEHYRTRTILLLSLLFAAAVPAGALLYHAIAGSVDQASFGAIALAFSAGSFLHLAVADLIPDLHRVREKRGLLSAALLGGVALMWLLSGVGGHDH